MKTITRRFNDSAYLLCAVAGRQERVVVLDAQKRATGYAYLVANTQGELYIAWENDAIVGVFSSELVRKSFRNAANDANVDLRAKRFASRAYIVN